MLSLVTMKFSPLPCMSLPTIFGLPVGSLKYPPDRFLNLFAAVHELKNDEQRHHRDDEVRISNLPGSAVVAAMADLFLDDDGRRSRHS